MDIKIISDSLADIPQETARALDIEVMPLTIIFDDAQYEDGVEITPAEMYKKIEASGKLPTSSQVTPQKFEEAFRKYVNEGYTVIYIGSSSRASGTFQSALVAKNAVGSEEVHVFDTYLLSYASGMIAVEAARMAKEGKNPEQILKRSQSMKERMGCLFTVDTLDYLKRGGRLSATKAAIGTILNVKPLLTLEDGIVKHLKNVRGTKKALEEMLDIIISEAGESPEQITISHGLDMELFSNLQDMAAERMDMDRIQTSQIGAVIGIHTGPSVAAAFYLKK
ncbi:DegV domain-containing protein [Peptoclostridium acidaminophilum DSM 3953]|uniref:DegV domain-containing protein n=1 Tax=Peptoclostridium acidaminophilum DSM 3953 TaxID=1286171 RepID=W8TJ12_PEPAC|nr:DegV family protein [Peptoclostridium acidaminophilum]AHM56172.1 DegV domain-containing protein [Peptoclostridium acidaminophilum DSM 3953]